MEFSRRTHLGFVIESSASGGDKVKKIVINRLFQSFAELEQAIVLARETLRERGNVSPGLLKRIEDYEEILVKQRNLATVMCGHAAIGNWDEVNRHIKLINGLSCLIRDDALEIIGAAEPETFHQQHDVTYC